MDQQSIDRKGEHYSAMIERSNRIKSSLIDRTLYADSVEVPQFSRSTLDPRQPGTSWERTARVVEIAWLRGWKATTSDAATIDPIAAINPYLPKDYAAWYEIQDGAITEILNQKPYTDQPTFYDIRQETAHWDTHPWLKELDKVRALDGKMNPLVFNKAECGLRMMLMNAEAIARVQEQITSERRAEALQGFLDAIVAVEPLLGDTADFSDQAVDDSAA